MRTGNPLSFFFDNLNLFASKTGAHLGLSVVAIGLAILLAIPLGVWLGHLHRGSFLAISVSNIGRALPSLTVISIGIGIIGIGFWNVVVALIILAGPVILTNAYVAVDEVDPDAVQAARAMGMTPFQVLRQIELPLALPLIFAIDGLFALVQHRLTPIPLRRQGRRARAATTRATGWETG